MRRRNAEDDFVKSTGQRVVFVAIIVYSNARSIFLPLFFGFVPFSFVSTLNPNTELNPKRFFCSLFLFFFLE